MAAILLGEERDYMEAIYQGMVEKDFARLPAIAQAFLGKLAPSASFLAYHHGGFAPAEAFLHILKVYRWKYRIQKVVRVNDVPAEMDAVRKQLAHYFTDSPD